MGRPRVLVVTTALHHKHRYRLHSFLPYLRRHLEVDVVDLAPLGYDMGEGEPVSSLLARALGGLVKEPVRHEFLEGVDAYTIRSPIPGDFGPLATLPVFTVLLNKLGNKNYDAVLATPFLAGMPALYASRRLEVPLIYEDVDRFYDFFKNRVKRALMRALELYLVERSDAVIAASPHLYIEDLRVRGRKSTFFVPNGVELGRFRRAREKTRRRDRSCIVYVGAVEWWSGLDLVIKALSRVVKAPSNVKFYVIGEHRTPYGYHLSRLVGKLGLEGRVVFMGRKPYDYVVEFLPRCSVGVLTFPYSEVTLKAFPYKVLEYCAAGLPVVMTDVTALAKLVKRYRAGSVHSVGDVEGVASAIAELIVDDAAWRELSSNAVRLASMFDVEKLALREAKVIQGML